MPTVSEKYLAKKKAAEEKEAKRAHDRLMRQLPLRAKALQKIINAKGVIQEYDEKTGWLKVSFPQGRSLLCRGPVVERALGRKKN